MLDDRLQRLTEPKVKLIWFIIEYTKCQFIDLEEELFVLEGPAFKAAGYKLSWRY